MITEEVYSVLDVSTLNLWSKALINPKSLRASTCDFDIWLRFMLPALSSGPFPSRLLREANLAQSSLSSYNFILILSAFSFNRWERQHALLTFSIYKREVFTLRTLPLRYKTFPRHWITFSFYLVWERCAGIGLKGRSRIPICRSNRYNISV